MRCTVLKLFDYKTFSRAFNTLEGATLAMATILESSISQQPSLKPSAAPTKKNMMTPSPLPTLMAKPALWHLSPDEHEDISRSITQTWTEQAVRCYMSGADCANCDIPKGQYSFVCQMNKVVPVLLDTLGQPDNKIVQKLYPQGMYPWMVEQKALASNPA
jgi:hypothetical protein